MRLASHRLASLPAAALLACALLAAAVAGVARAEVAVPPLERRVTDLVGVLDAGTVTALEQKLAAFEQRKGSQVAVLIVPTTEPETIEQYGIRVADAWKLGREGIDDGALLLVAIDDRKLRIEVGYGLEGPMPDLVAKRIVSDVIAPQFKAGNFAGGIDAGVDWMLKVIDGEPLPEPDRGWQGDASVFEALLPLLLIGSLVIGGILRAIFGKVGGAAATGGLVGVVTWFIAGLLGIAALAAVFAFVIALIGGMPRRGWSTGGRGGRGGGWGNWGGGGGFGGGGFGGGGGGFGGGGASGGW